MPERIPADLSRIGSVLRITPADVGSWDVAIGQAGWWRTPAPARAAVISDGNGYLIDVVERRIVIEQPGVERIAEDERHDLVLMSTDRGLVAIDGRSVVWRHDVFWPDLKVERFEPDAIVCSSLGDSPRRPEVRFDPRDGSRL